MKSYGSNLLHRSLSIGLVFSLSACATTPSDTRMPFVEGAQSSAPSPPELSATSDTLPAASQEQTQSPRPRTVSLFDDVEDDTVFPYAFQLHSVRRLNGPLESDVLKEGLLQRSSLLGECFPGTLNLTGAERWTAEILVISEFSRPHVSDVVLGRDARNSLPRDVQDCLASDFASTRLSQDFRDEDSQARFQVEFGVRVLEE